jgi:hypothetical protein
MLDLLIPSVFSKDEQGFLTTLIEESTDQKYVAQIILDRLGKDPLANKILPIQSAPSYIFAIALIAPFKYDDTEPYEVMNALSAFDKRPAREYVTDIMREVETRKISHKDAGRALFRYTTLFAESIHHNVERRGAPKLSFYVQHGKGFYNVASQNKKSSDAQTCEYMYEHFEKWRSHFLEHLVLNPN